MKLLKNILKYSPKEQSLELDLNDNYNYSPRINNLPQLKTSYRVKGGLIGKETRKCSEF